MIPDSVKATAILAGGKKMQVIGSDGKSYEFQEDAGTDEARTKEGALVQVLRILLEADRLRNEEMKRMSAELAELRKALEKNAEATQAVAEDNKAVLQSIGKLDATLRLPVVGKRQPDGTLRAIRQG